MTRRVQTGNYSYCFCYNYYTNLGVRETECQSVRVEGITDAGLLVNPIDQLRLRGDVFNLIGRLGESRKVVVVIVFVIIITLI